MITIGIDNNSRAIVAYVKELYIDTEAKVLRLKLVQIWLNQDGTEFKRDARAIIFTDSMIHHYVDTGQVDETGNPVQVPVSQWAHWMGQALQAGPAYDVLAAFIEANLVTEGYVQEVA